MGLKEVLIHIGGATNRKKSKFHTPRTVDRIVVKVEPKKQTILRRTPTLTVIEKMLN